MQSKKIRYSFQLSQLAKGAITYQSNNLTSLSLLESHDLKITDQSKSLFHCPSQSSSIIPDSYCWFSWKYRYHVYSRSKYFSMRKIQMDLRGHRVLHRSILDLDSHSKFSSASKHQAWRSVLEVLFNYAFVVYFILQVLLQGFADIFVQADGRNENGTESW
jgi:hypothetical protein